MTTTTTPTDRARELLDLLDRHDYTGPYDVSGQGDEFHDRDTTSLIVFPQNEGHAAAAANLSRRWDLQPHMLPNGKRVLYSADDDRRRVIVEWEWLPYFDGVVTR